MKNKNNLFYFITITILLIADAFITYNSGVVPGEYISFLRQFKGTWVTFSWEPIYPIFTVIFEQITGLSRAMTLIVTREIIVLLIIIFYYKTITLIFDRRFSLLAVIFMLLSASLISIKLALLRNLLSVLFIIVAIYFISRFIKQEKIKFFLWFLFFGVMSSLAHVSGVLLFALLLFSTHLHILIYKKEYLKKILIIDLIPFVSVLGYAMAKLLFINNKSSLSGLSWREKILNSLGIVDSYFGSSSSFSWNFDNLLKFIYKTEIIYTSAYITFIILFCVLINLIILIKYKHKIKNYFIFISTGFFLLLVYQSNLLFGLNLQFSSRISMLMFIFIPIIIGATFYLIFNKRIALVLFFLVLSIYFINDNYERFLLEYRFFTQFNQEEITHGLNSVKLSETGKTTSLYTGNAYLNAEYNQRFIPVWQAWEPASAEESYQAIKEVNNDISYLVVNNVNSSGTSSDGKLLSYNYEKLCDKRYFYKIEEGYDEFSNYALYKIEKDLNLKEQAKKNCFYEGKIGELYINNSGKNFLYFNFPKNEHYKITKDNTWEEIKEPETKEGILVDKIIIPKDEEINSFYGLFDSYLLAFSPDISWEFIHWIERKSSYLIIGDLKTQGEEISIYCFSRNNLRHLLWTFFSVITFISLLIISLLKKEETVKKNISVSIKIGIALLILIIYLLSL